MANLVVRAVDTLARVFGAEQVIRGTTRMPSMLGVKVMPDLALWHQFQRIGGNLTPAQVSSIIRQADTGDMRRLMDLANDARQKDCHLQSILGQAEEAITELDWRLVLPEDAKQRDLRAAREVEQMLRECKGSMVESKDGFTDLIAHLTGSHYYGHACSEAMYRKRDGNVVPERYENLAARRFGYRQEDGKFIWRDDIMGWKGVAIRDEFPNKFVLAQPRVNGDVPCREGLVRPLMWAALFRNWDLADWLRTAELSWKPWRIGSYTKNASQEDIDGLDEVLQNLATNGSAKLSEFCSVEVFWPQGAGSRNATHVELFDVLGREMSKAVLGSTDTIDGSKARGLSQSKVQSDGEKRRIRSRAKYIGEVLTRDQVRPLTEMNFGKTVRVADFQFVIKEPVDLKAFGEGIDKLVGAGAKVTQKYVQDVTGMPEPKETDELLKPAKVVAAEAIANAKPEDEDDPNEPDDGDEPDPGDDTSDEDETPEPNEPKKPAKKPKKAAG